MRITIKSSLTSAAAVLLLASGIPSHAQDTSNWKCELCPFDEGYRADYEAGAQFVSDDAFRFGNGTGYDEEGGYGLLNGSGHRMNDGLRFEWQVNDLALDSRDVGVAVGRQGHYDYSLSYSETPVRRYGTTRTVFAPAAFDSLTLPGGWTRAGLTSGLTDLGSSLAPQAIEQDLSVLEFGARYIAHTNFSWYADYRQRRREGTDIVSGAWFTQANYLPRPVDTQTDEIDVGATFSRGGLDLTLAWYGSFFKNEALSLSFDNPFIGPPGADRGQLARPPDNSYQQVSLSGVWQMDAWDSVVAVRAASGRGEQDESLLPYTINASVASSPLPRTSLDGKVDTSNYTLTWTARPHPRARIKASYRFDERDNQTQQATWTRVITDSFASGSSEVNLPYSYERARLDLSGRLKIFDDLDLLGGYTRTDVERDFQEVAEQTEDSGWGKLRWGPLPWLDVSVRGGASRREIDRYDEAFAQSLGQNPLLRKYNLAYRFREFGELALTASVPDTQLSIGATLMVSDDSYSRSQLGITDSDEERLAIDLSYAFSENASAYLTFGSETIEATQLGSEGFAAADWVASHDDEFDHIGGGLVVRQIGDKVDLMLDVIHSEGQTDIRMSGAAVQSGVFPALDSTLDSLRLSVDYGYSKRLDVSIGVRYERFETRDWSLDGVQVDTLPTILTLGAASWDYDVWVVGLGFRYRLGGGPIEFPD